MVIQEINMGGINPTVCHPNPRPTTLRFFWHINSSVPKTKFYVCGWDLGGMKDWKKGKLLRNAKQFQKWDWVGWMIEKVKVEQNCKIISKVGLGGIRWDEWLKKVKVEQKCNFLFFSKLDWVGLLIENVREKQNWESESYVLGRIDSKTGGMHNISYTPTSASCKSSNTQNEEKNWLWKM